jgi:acyl-CoA thioesterase
VRSGRRFSTVRAVMAAGRRRILAMLGTFADPVPSSGPERVEARPPDLPPPEDCVALEPGDGFPPPFVGRVELRLHPADARFTDGSGPPRFRGWLRFPDARPIDALGLLVAVDAFPPTAFNADLPMAWTPTLELTAHVRARPAPGWLRCVFTTRFITGGFLEEDGEVWDAAGRLVAQSRQLALAPRE